MDLIRIENVRGKERPVYSFTSREEVIKFSKEYLDKHGTGAPPVFIMEDGNRVRVQFNKERTSGSLRNIDTKTGSRGLSTSLRDVDLENTTLDPAMKGGKGFAAVQNTGPVHHAAAARVVGKMHRQFELNQNPDWKPSDGPTPEGRTFLRNIQNRAGVNATGNNPVNLRPYPADNPSKPTVSTVHDDAHRLGRVKGIDPQTVDFKDYTDDQLYQYAKNTLAPSIKEIDDQLGYASPVKSVGQAGAIARGKQPPVPGIEFKNSPISMFREKVAVKRATRQAASKAPPLLGGLALATGTLIAGGSPGQAFEAFVETENPLEDFDAGPVFDEREDYGKVIQDAKKQNATPLWDRLRQGVLGTRAIRGRSGAQRALQGG